MACTVTSGKKLTLGTQSLPVGSLSSRLEVLLDLLSERHQVGEFVDEFNVESNGFVDRRFKPERATRKLITVSANEFNFRQERLRAAGEVDRTVLNSATSSFVGVALLPEGIQETRF